MQPLSQTRREPCLPLEPHSRVHPIRRELKVSGHPRNGALKRRWEWIGRHQNLPRRIAPAPDDGEDIDVVRRPLHDAEEIQSRSAYNGDPYLDPLGRKQLTDSSQPALDGGIGLFRMVVLFFV